MTSNTALMKQELFELLKTESFKKGQFQLASGAFSDYYLDCRLTTLNGRGAYLLGYMLTDLLKDFDQSVSLFFHSAASSGLPVTSYKRTR